MTTSLVKHNRELVLGALDAVKSGDIDGFMSVMHPDLSIHEPEHLPYGGIYKGGAGFLRLFAEAAKILDLSKIELVSATADESRTVLLMTVPLLSTGETVHITEHWCVKHEWVTDVRVFWFEAPRFA